MMQLLAAVTIIPTASTTAPTFANSCIWQHELVKADPKRVIKLNTTEKTHLDEAKLDECEKRHHETVNKPGSLPTVT